MSRGASPDSCRSGSEPSSGQALARGHHAQVAASYACLPQRSLVHAMLKPGSSAAKVFSIDGGDTRTHTGIVESRMEVREPAITEAIMVKKAIVIKEPVAITETTAEEEVNVDHVKVIKSSSPPGEEGIKGPAGEPTDGTETKAKANVTSKPDEAYKGW